MPLFTPLSVKRTLIATDNPVNFDGGLGGMGFYTPSHKYFGWQVIPHDNKWSNGTPSFMAPVSHYHLLQEEKFHIQSGSGYWFMQGKKIKLSAGEDITIPRFVSHRFESIPNEKKEPLVILYRFRNILPYMDDCRKAGVEPSLLQLCIFLADCWMPGDFLPVPGGNYMRCAVNTLFMWIMALIGMVLFGYKRSYVEYYDPKVSRRRIEEDSKKGK